MRAGCDAVVERSEATLLKYIRCQPRGVEELYDLGTDPNERNNLIESAEVEAVRRLRDQLQQHLLGLTVD